MKILVLRMLLVVTMGISFFASHAIAGSGGISEITSKERLGQLLYFDQDLSIYKNQACASCHFPPAFVDPANAADPANNVVSLGSDVTLNGGRNAPSAGYAAFSPFFHWDPVEGLYVGGQFWDGRANTLADQAKGPFLNPVEMAMPSKDFVLKRIASHRNSNRAEYEILWEQVYGVRLKQLRDPESDVEVNALYDMVADAIAAFEKTRFFSPFTSKFDYYLAGEAELTDQELNGLALFEGKAQCNACHPSEPLMAPGGGMMPPLFTDYTYDNIGVPKSENPLIVDNPVDLGLGGRPDIAAKDPEGAEIGKHKVMSLRNIAATPPYAHNGYFATLEDVVHFYNTRDVADAGWPAPEVTQNVNTDELGNLGLTAEEEAAIVAFLKTLTDGYSDKPIYDFPSLPFP
jgi:cytochrome c peroxidase